MDKSTPTERWDGLDAMRGLALFGMALSGMIPFGILPNWMYHAQVPPPDHKFNPAIPGISWVDLVFPLFLFAMGAAIPLVVQKRLEKGDTASKLAVDFVVRLFLLAAFAILIQNTKPPSASSPLHAYGPALGVFLLLFPILGRWPARLPQAWDIGLRMFGTAGLIGLLSQWQTLTGQALDLYKNDIILLVLANVACFGGLIYLLTRDKPHLRLAFLVFWTVIVISRNEPGWVKTLWKANEPVRFLYNAEFLKYLLIVLPATWVSEAFLRSRNDMESKAQPNIKGVPEWMQGLLAFGSISAITGLLFFRHVEGAIGAGILGFGFLLVSRPNRDWTFLTLVLGAAMLAVGMAFEPFQGGIKKDSATLSYFFVTSGLACLALFGFASFQVAKLGAKLSAGFVAIGQNPILGYAVITHVMPFLWKGCGLEGWFVGRFGVEPGPGFLRGLSETLLFALVVYAFTRLKVFLRA